MCQITAGTLKDSAYGVHNDCGFHHNHTMEGPQEAVTQLQRDIFHQLPSDGLMRVVTLVVSTSAGSNARLVFTDPADNDREVISVNTTANCIHIQNFGCQKYLRHQVVAATPSVGKVDAEGMDNVVRLVFSFRYSIDNRDHDIMSAVIGDDEKLRNSGRRGDYTVCNILGALETGFKPTPAKDIQVGESVSYASENSRTGTIIDPSRLLVDGGVGFDKPSRLPSDTIPSDQQSISETTSGDTFQYKDAQELWQRVTSAPFLRCLS
jgi:hypothetical protein